MPLAVNVLSWLSPLDLPDRETKPMAAMQFAITSTSLVQLIETHPQHNDQPNVNPHCDKINLEQTEDYPHVCNKLVNLLTPLS
jgi:hypothetical protein